MGHSFYACSHRTKHRENEPNELPEGTAQSPPPLRPIQHGSPSEAFTQHSEQMRHKTASTTTAQTKRSPSTTSKHKRPPDPTQHPKRSIRPSTRNKCKQAESLQYYPPPTKERPPCISKADTTTRSNIRRISAPKTPAPKATFAEHQHQRHQHPKQHSQSIERTNPPNYPKTQHKALRPSARSSTAPQAKHSPSTPSKCDTKP